MIAGRVRFISRHRGPARAEGEQVVRAAIYTAIFCSLLAVVTWASVDSGWVADRAWVLQTETQSMTNARGRWKSVSLDRIAGARLDCEEALVRSMRRQVQGRREVGATVLSSRELAALGAQDGPLHLITMSIPAHCISEVFQGQRERGGLIFYRYTCLKASTENEIDAAFASLAQLHARALVVGADPFLTSRRKQLVALASRHAVPSIYAWLEFADSGGLISYGASKPHSCLSPDRHLHRKDPQGRQASRSAGPAADHLRAGHQPQDRQGAGADDPAVAAGAGGRGDPVVMDRRTFLAGTGAVLLAAPLAAEAQQAAKMPRIGFLGNSTAALEANLVGPFREGLRDLGYVEGQNIRIEYRWAEGQYERFPALIAELIALKVDVIVTAGTPAALAVKKATTSIPLVMAAVGDPIGVGLVASLARPGGNVTGLSAIAPELEGKRLELLREVVPKLSHIAVLWNPDNPFLAGSLKETRAAAQVLGIKVQLLRVRTAEDFPAAFAAILKERPGALLVLADRIFLHNRARIVDFEAKRRLPGVYPYRELVEAGGLMSFGPSYAGMHRRAAYYVDKILKGAKPADLPVEQPTKFDLMINLKAAKALGLTIPPSVLARADEVIQ